MGVTFINQLNVGVTFTNQLNVGVIFTNQLNVGVTFTNQLNVGVTLILTQFKRCSVTKQLGRLYYRCHFQQIINLGVIFGKEFNLGVIFQQTIEA